MKKTVSRNQQIAEALAESSHQEVQPQQIQKFPVVQCLPQLLVNAPPVEVSDSIRVCRSVAKGWYLEARIDMPAGERVAVYPLTIKADPAWPTEHLSPDKVAQQSQYLMPIYAKQSSTNCMYKVKRLVGDVSRLAPVEFEGVPCVAHLVNEAMTREQINVAHEY